MQHLNQLPVLILGLGASGLAMARWCARHGAIVTVADTREAPPQLQQLREEVPSARFVSGPFTADLLDGNSIRAVYRSPGLSPAAIAPVVDAARAVGLVVGGELDLFARALRDLDAQRRAAYEAELHKAQITHQEQLALFDAERAPTSQSSSVDNAPADQAARGDEDVQAAVVDHVQASESDAEATEGGHPPDPVEADASAATAESLTSSRDAVSEVSEVTASTEAAEPAATPPTSGTASAELPATAVVVSDEEASDTTAERALQPYVPHAAREAAAFVAGLSELSAPAPLQEVVSEPIAVAPVLVRPSLPEGYKPAVLAITGTNGKTTVTSLTGQLVASVGKSVAVAGNIGPTLLDTLAGHLDAGTLPEVWVLELSSFQLDGVQDFEPTAATVLNLSQDHLDWHGDMAHYAQAKARIFGQTGLMLLNREDAAVMAMLPAPVKVKLQKPQVRAHMSFGADLPRRPGDFGIERVNGMAWLVRAHEADETQKRKRGAVHEEEIHLQRLMPADALRIRGQHNALNALAALALASAAGCPLAPMLYGLREYRGEPHRVEPVALIDGVEYFDDSKGTNVGATAAALLGLGVERKLVPILGGDGKGQDFSPLLEPVARFARSVVLIGRDAPQIEAALSLSGVPVVHARDMEEAVRLAAQQARSGDAVLLSPACASLDMYRSYVHRAEVFVAAVQALADDPASRQEAGAQP